MSTKVSIWGVTEMMAAAVPWSIKAAWLIISNISLVKLDVLKVSCNDIFDYLIFLITKGKRLEESLCSPTPKRSTGEALGHLDYIF